MVKVLKILSVGLLCMGSLCAMDSKVLVRAQKDNAIQPILNREKVNLLYLKSNDGKVLDIDWDTVKYFHDVVRKLNENGELGSSHRNPLPIAVSQKEYNQLISDIDIMMRKEGLGRDKLKTEYVCNRKLTSDNEPHASLISLIRTASLLGCRNLLELASDAFVERLKEPQTLEAFRANSEFIKCFDFDQNLLKNLASKVLNENDIYSLLEFLCLKIKSSCRPTQLSFNCYNAYFAASGCAEDGKASLCEIWGLREKMRQEKAERPEKVCNIKHPLPIRGHAFLASPMLVTYADENLIIWNVISGLAAEVLTTKDVGRENQKFTAMCVSKDLSMIALGLGKDVLVMDMKSGYVRSFAAADLSPDTGYAEQLFFTSDGCRLIEIRNVGAVRIWDVTLGVCEAQARATCDIPVGFFVKKFHYNPAKKIFITVTHNARIIFWNLDTKAILDDERALEGMGLCFNSDGSRLAIAHRGKGLSILDVDKKCELDCLAMDARKKIAESEFVDGCYHPSKDWLAVVDTKAIYLIDVSNGKIMGQLSFDSACNCLTFSFDGNILASSHQDGYLRFWHFTNRAIKEYLGISGERRKDEKRQFLVGVDLPKALILLLIIQAKKKNESINFIKELPHLKAIYDSLDENLIKRFFP